MTSDYLIIEGSNLKTPVTDPLFEFGSSPGLVRSLY